MPITAWVISVLAILEVPILLIRFPKRWIAAFNLAITNRVTSLFAGWPPEFGILTHVGFVREIFLDLGNICRTGEFYVLQGYQNHPGSMHWYELHHSNDCG